MELTEPIESINNQLIDLFGIDTITGMPIWRVVWSEEQFEHRLGTYEDFTSNGIYVRTVKEVRYVPKYRQWIQEKYVLERLVIIPFLNELDLPDKKLSYEPIYVFEDAIGRYLPPKLIAAKFVIDALYATQYENHDLAKYKDPNENFEESMELKDKRVKELQEAIFGDETDISDALARGEGISVPSNYKKVN